MVMMMNGRLEEAQGMWDQVVGARQSGTGRHDWVHCRPPPPPWNKRRIVFYCEYPGH